MSYILIHYLILAVYLPLGIYSIFRPIYLLFLFVGLTIIPYIPTIPYDDDTILEIIRIGSIRIYVIDYLTTIMFLILFYNIMNNSRQFRIIIGTKIGFAVIMLFSWDIIIGIISYTKGFSIQNLLRYFATDSLILIPFLIPQIKNINNSKDNFYKFTVYTALLLVIFSLIRYFITKEMIYTSSGTARTLTANSIILFILPLCYILYHNNTLKFKKITSSLLIISLLAGVCMAGYRSGWVVLFFVISMYLIYKVFNNIKLLWMPMLAASLMTLLLFIGTNYQYKKLDAGRTLLTDVIIRVADIFDLENKTTQGRLSTWEFALNIVHKYPVLGLGRLPVYTLHTDESNINVSKFNEMERGAHNIFFDKIIHEGIAGVSILALFFYIILHEARKLAKIDLNYSRFISVYLMGFIIFSMLNTSFSSSTGKILFFIMVGFLNNELFRINLHEKHTIRIA